ncbi:hypothetical protein [Aromatoleum diolicum]|uniref:Uncharacterized protein n=1 Tax=Aromatoleum diolicum TaxID=75796 RepID=A0ABX1QE21_9RHOO|nr:hypothetical protein [Aromatoleum diolicum]NMG75646.1 hypothetical protein [Aromatoleum diolicum]
MTALFSAATRLALERRRRGLPRRDPPAEVGLGWCIDEDTQAPARHRLAEDAQTEHANGGCGIRFRRAHATLT